MDEAQFWRLVEHTPEDSRAWVESLVETLTRSGLDEVTAFAAHLDRAFDSLYTWDLWAVAFIIDHGCSNDSFDDFRSCVIARGRTATELAVRDPTAFGLQYDHACDRPECDRLQFVAGQAHERLTGAWGPPRSVPPPSRPAGDDWIEADLPRRFPLVWARWM
jgi:hypothetical protein